MKSFFYERGRYVLSLSLLYLKPFVASAQTSPTNPSSWEVLITSSQNYAIRDTFLMQTFSGSEDDNWLYESKGSTSLVDPKEYGLMNASEGNVLMISASGEVDFTPFSTTGYESPIIRSPYGCYQVVPGEILHIQAAHESKPGRDYDWLTPPKSYSSHFQEKKENALYASPHIHISGGYNSLSIKVGKATGVTNGGFYAFDSVYASGLIPTYSLFEGIGNWSNSKSWSHLPAMRNRKALVNGDITIDENIHINAIYLTSGSLTVNKEKRVEVNDLYLLEDHALYSFGELDIANQLTVYLSSMEKEKWYFLSFPFDVYADGVDARLQFRDDKETTTGSYFYLMRYDGDKRAATGMMTDNWEVISSTQFAGGGPLFEKNRGYLFALDKGAPSDTLRFYAKKGDTPSDFGRNGKVEINLPAVVDNVSADHYGWVLCGNPMPAPLPLSRIRENPDLDGYVYVYDGAEYKAYEIGGDYAIPAYGAFFVKASKSTVLRIEESEPSLEYRLLSSSPINRMPGEPSVDDSVTDNENVKSADKVEVYVNEGRLYVKNYQSNSRLSIYNMSGVNVLTQTLPEHGSILPISLSRGVYIVHVEGVSACNQVIMVR